jgi:hypothetical protein
LEAQKQADHEVPQMSLQQRVPLQAELPVSLQDGLPAQVQPLVFPLTAAGEIAQEQQF